MQHLWGKINQKLECALRRLVVLFIGKVSVFFDFDYELIILLFTELVSAVVQPVQPRYKALKEVNHWILVPYNVAMLKWDKN